MTEGDETVLDTLITSLRRAADYVKYDQEPPVCVLWTDEKRQWEPLLPRLRDAMPELLTLGPYNPETRTGPAIWVRCAITRTLPDFADGHDDVTPVLYLPGIGKQDLRAVETAPYELQPLAELQYRGVVWNQPQGQRDWTVYSWLSNASGLAIDVLRDGPTQEMLLHALAPLAAQPVARLRAEAPLRAAWLRGLLLPDVTRTLLLWIGNPDHVRTTLDSAQWEALTATCREQYGLDAEGDGVLTAAVMLAGREGPWEAVWDRFAESPTAFPGVADALRRAPRPFTGTLSSATGAWPQENDEAEASLRAALVAFSALDPPEVRERVHVLEAEHGARRTWVWAKLGQAPLADALAALVRLAEATTTPLSGGSVPGIVAAYVGGDWHADAAVLAALAAVTDSPDVAAVKTAVRALYMIWLRDAAEAFATAIREDDAGYVSPSRTNTAPKAGVCILFADGLRFDVGNLLADRLIARGLTTTVTPHLAALPTVTPTAKPAISPVAGRFGPGAGFDLVVAETGQKVNIEVLRQQLAASGYTVLRGDETGDGMGSAWTESGALDAYGHGQQWKLARRVQEEVGELADRIAALLASGWHEVRVVTDHGWLLLPGGLPKAEIPVGITEERKGRCARLKDNATWGGQSVVWHWDDSVRVAVAPGISCFESGKEYEHGGLSPQECIVPVLRVTAATTTPSKAVVESVRWTRLRCRVTVSGATTGCAVDIRTKAGDAASTVTQAVRDVSEDGTALLFVPDDDYEGTAAFVVLLDAQGSVLHQYHTVIGG